MNAYVCGPSGNYWEILFFHLCVGVSQMMIGAVSIVIAYYCMKNSPKDDHIMLCTIGHFFLCQAILTFNYANGWSAPLKYKHRWIIHGIIQAAAFGCTCAGTIISWDGISSKSHGLTGQLAALFSLISLALAPLAIFAGKYGKIVHITIGMPTIIISTVSLCYGLLNHAFKDWSGQPMTKVLICFIAFYTFFIFFATLMQYISRLTSFKSNRYDDDDYD